MIVLPKEGSPVALKTDRPLTGANGIEFSPDGALYVGGDRLWGGERGRRLSLKRLARPGWRISTALSSKRMASFR